MDELISSFLESVLHIESIFMSLGVCLIKLRMGSGEGRGGNMDRNDMIGKCSCSIF